MKLSTTLKNGSASIYPVLLGKGLNHRNLAQDVRVGLAADVVTGARPYIPSCNEACVTFRIPHHLLTKELKARRELAALPCIMRLTAAENEMAETETTVETATAETETVVKNDAVGNGKGNGKDDTSNPLMEAPRESVPVTPHAKLVEIVGAIGMNATIDLLAALERTAR
jgi:hypothetical protein